MKDKITAVITALLMCAPLAASAAEETETAAAETAAEETEAAETVTAVFTAESAVEYAYENSLDLKAQEENVKSISYQKDAARVTRKNLENMGYAYSESDMDYFLYGSGYMEFSCGKQYDIAVRSLEFSKYSLRMQVENKFYSCLNADKKTEVARDALDTAEENERIAKAKAEEGTVGALEADSFALAVVEAQNDLDDAERERDYMYEELRQLLSYPVDGEFTLSGSFERQPMNATELEDALAGLDEYTLKLNLDDSLAIQENLTEVYRRLYTSSAFAYAYQAQNFAYAQAAAEYNENVGQLRLDVMSAYNSMVSVYSQLDYIDAAIELKEEQTDARKTSYEMGLSTAAEYIEAERELDSLRLQRTDAEIGAYLASQAYELSFHKVS